MFLSKPQIVRVQRPRMEAAFGSDPGFVPQALPDLFMFDGPLIYKYQNTTIKIPKGCTTDFASSPKALDWIPFLDIDGLSRLPGALHDGIYRLGREKGKDWADNVLYDACLSVGLSKWQSGVYYRGVHWFGKGGWDGDGAMGNFGSALTKFVSKADYDAWVAAGATIYS